MKNRRPLAYSFILSIALPIAFAIVAAMVGCAKVQTTGGSGANSGGGGTGGLIGGGSGGALGPIPGCVGPCTDFPPAPILDTGIAGDPGSMFSGTAPTFGGPCITEPEDGTLYPNNWMRPRVKFTNTGKLIQIRMHAANQQNDLVAYTTNDLWIMDLGVWTGLRGHQVGFANQVTVTIWIQGAGASTTHFNTAPVGASGNMIFWAADPTVVGVMPAQCQANPALCNNAAELRAFAVGSETTQSVLQIGQVAQQSRLDSGNLAKVTCIGCHSGTPDSGFVLFVDNYPWRAVSASVQMGSPGTSWTTTPTGLAALRQPGWGPFTFTKTKGTNDFWQAGKRIMVGALGLRDPIVPDPSNGPDQNDSPHLAWINLEGSAVRTPRAGRSGELGLHELRRRRGHRVGQRARLHRPQRRSQRGRHTQLESRRDDDRVRVDERGAERPAEHGGDEPGPNPGDPTHNATQANANGARTPGLTNIYTVPFNNGLGGTATPVNGAASPEFEEYYPAFSPDDKFLAFTFVPAGQVMYANPQAQIAIVAKGAASGSKPTVLAANNPMTSPPNCTGKMSPGVNNHWPKWSPEVQPSSDGTYYWLIFSSNRTGGNRAVQLRSPGPHHQPALRRSGGGGREQPNHPVPRHLSLEPAGGPCEHDTGLGNVRPATDSVKTIQ